MRKTDETDQAIRAGLKYIASQQLKSGGFDSFSSPSRVPFVPELTYKTTFVPSLILGALAQVDSSKSQSICRRTAAYLYRQASPSWSFNYWAKRTKQRRTQPYPDDLDDTFCALAALYLYNPASIDAGILAKATKLLLATESAVGGPYRTWLVSIDSKPVWLDVDVAVNANVAYFLTLIGSPLPKLISFLDEAISSKKMLSPYYPSIHMSVYYIARGYNGSQRAVLREVLRELLKRAETALETALCASSLLRLGAGSGTKKAIDALLAAQGADGAWPGAAFCLDPAIGGQSYYNGAPALTTAFAVEALQLYKQDAHTRSARSRTYTPDKGDPDRTLSTAVLRLAKKQCQNLDPELRSAIMEWLGKITDSRNSLEIIGLPGSFYKALIKSPRGLKTGFIEALSLANLYGWLAYTIYDDFLDEEGQPKLIPVANAAMRRSLDNYLDCRPTDEAFRAFVRRTFDIIDSANAWELQYCRFARHGNNLAVGRLPNYGDLTKLAERSIGHALPCVAVLAAAGKGPNTEAAQNILIAFRHYLIARQLNDDAHDWPEDLQNGHITPVVAQLLRELKVGRGNHELTELIAAARPQFWNSTLLETCHLMRRHIRLSRQYLKRSTVLQTDNVISILLDAVEASITDTLSQQRQAKDFLKQYKHPIKQGIKS